MGKAVQTVASLAAVGVGAVLTGGIGAVPLGVMFGSAATGLAAIGVTSSMVGTLAGFLVTTSLNALSQRAFANKPKAASFNQEAVGRKDTVRSSIESHKIIYGQARVGGALGFIGTTDSGANASGTLVTGDNKFLHILLILAGHEVDSIADIYFNDKLVPLDANGWATSAPYAESNSTATTVTKVINNLVRTGGSSVTVTTTTAHGFSAGDVVSISPGRSGYDFGGTVTITGTPTATTFTYTQTGMNYTAVGGEVSKTTVVTATTSYVRVKKFLGTDSQAASPEMLSEVPGWTADHRLRGLAYIHVRLEYNRDVFPSGIPAVTALVKGKKVYDPRDATTKWTDNAALCVRDYLTSRDGGNLPYGFGASSSEINDTYATAAANVCEETVYKLDGTASDRFTCNGVLDTAVAPTDNLQQLVSAMAGAVTCPQGKFRIHAGAYDPPESTVIDESMLTGPIKVKARTERSELFNAVRGTYIDPTKNWQATDFPPITSADYEAEDNGERIFTDVQLPFTIDPELAQRIARLLLRKSREQLTVTMPLNYKALQFAVWDTVLVNNEKLGWSEKRFRIEKWTFDLTGGVMVQLKEDNPEGYFWESTDAQVIAAAPDTNLPSPTTVAPPKGLGVTESQYVTRDGAGVKAKATLRWVASADAFAREYQAEYKIKTDSAWTLLPRTSDVTAEILDITPETYDFRVKALNSLGVSSAYATASQYISGLLDAPTAPSRLDIGTIGGLAVLGWDRSPDLDVMIGGRYIIRHSPDEAGTWETSTTIGNSVPGTSVTATLPLKPGVYMIKAEDSSGVQSSTYMSAYTSQATALAYANVTSLTEHPAFSGEMINTYVDDYGRLTIAGDWYINTYVGMIDDIPDWDSYGGIYYGFYRFSGAIDLGSVKRIRATSHILAAVVNVLDKIDSREATLDYWEDFDGTAGAPADAWVSVRYTDDDPAGSPAWSEYVRLDSGEFEARAFEFRIDMESSDPSYNIAVSELSVSIDEVA